MSRDFPGTNGNYLDIGDVSAIDITGTALTVAAWIYPDVMNSSYRSIVGKDGGSVTTCQYDLYVHNLNKLTFQIGDGVNIDTTPTTGATLSAGVWTHVAGVKDGTGGTALRSYINGSQDIATTSNRSIANLTQSLRIGNRSSNDIPFDGRIAEVGIWDIALNASEIAALARGVSPRLIRPQNLKGYWPLYGTGSPERDYSGNGNAGTITGTVNAGVGHSPSSPIVLPFRYQLAAPGATVITDQATIYLDLQPSSVEIAETVDSATIYVDLQPSGVEEYAKYDAATIYLDMTVLGGECYSTITGNQLGEGEAYARWSSGIALERWTGEAEERWYGIVSVGDQIHC